LDRTNLGYNHFNNSADMKKIIYNLSTSTESCLTLLI
jgi:hypothetical protein